MNQRLDKRRRLRRESVQLQGTCALEKASERVEVTIANPNYLACIGMLANKPEAQNHRAFLLDAAP